ncbi:hypothetical protein O181_115747, partial [Austropuccinia psidii MF-1]|nr:hypothetical protein [Austropuccinia psidii MF-1]
SENVVRQENIETASTLTRIIPASTVNYDHNSTVNGTQNNQPEPISSELINLDISNTLQKAKNSANRASYNPSRSSQKGHRCDYGRSQSAIERQGGHLQRQPEGLQQCIAAQRVPDPCRSMGRLHEFLPDCEKIPGPSQHLQVTQWMASIDGKEEWRKNNPPPPKQGPKTAPVARSRNSNMKKQPQAQNKGKGKAPATKCYSQRYRMPWKMYFRWPEQ